MRPGGLMSSQPPSLVFSKCTFFGGRLGQRQRLVPVPHQCHQEGMGTKPFAVPKLKPLLLAMGGARAMNYPYLRPVGLRQGLAHSRAGISVHGTNEPVFVWNHCSCTECRLQDSQAEFL